MKFKEDTMNTKILSLILCAVFMFSGYAIAEFENFNEARKKKIELIDKKIKRIEKSIDKITDDIRGKHKLIKINPQSKVKGDRQIKILTDQKNSQLKKKGELEKELDTVNGKNKKKAFKFIKKNLWKLFLTYRTLFRDLKGKLDEDPPPKDPDLEKKKLDAELKVFKLRTLILKAAAELEYTEQEIEDLEKNWQVVRNIRERPIRSTARLIGPSVAIAGGIIVGTVMGTEDKPVSDTYVNISTIIGTVENVKTDKNGKFKSKEPIPSYKQILMLTTPGRKEKIERKIKIVTADELDFPQRPPEFIEPGKEFTVEGNYPNSEYVVEKYGESYFIPEARSVSKNGDVAITTLNVPFDIETGSGKWILTDAIGRTHRFISSIYKTLRAKVDQSALKSGEISEGEYVLDFGKELANQNLLIKIDVTGYIRLLGRDRPRPFRTDANGHAIIKFRVRAKRTPVPGKKFPFSISHKIYRPNR